jgi:lipoic acid synthetase
MTEQVQIDRVRGRLPVWFRRRLSESSTGKTHEVLGRHHTTTVCEEALCPNQSECFARNTATFMILGEVCTRACGFCSVTKGRPQTVDSEEPARVAQAVRELELKYVVITSVTRDDLADEGAGHFAETIRCVRKANPGVLVEVLTPDFHNCRQLIQAVMEACPVVYNHNLETVASLQARIRPQADYRSSLGVIQTVKELDPGMTTKSGLMLGLGESLDEVRSTARDLRSAGCDILTLGQYLAPGAGHLRVEKFISPQVFRELAEEFKALGFREVFAGPYVRSSYHAGETFLNS